MIGLPRVCFLLYAPFKVIFQLIALTALLAFLERPKYLLIQVSGAEISQSKRLNKKKITKIFSSVWKGGDEQSVVNYDS